MNKLLQAFRAMWPRDQKQVVSSQPAPSKGNVGHEGSKRPHACHSRPSRVGKRKASRAARRLNR